MADKQMRYCKIQLGKMKDELAAAAGLSLNIENLSKLQALLSEYREIKSRYDSHVEAIISELDDEDPGYEKRIAGILKDEATIRDVLAMHEGKVKAFYHKLEGQANRDSLVPSIDLNSSSRAANSSVQPKVEKIKIPTFDGNVLNFANFKGLFQNLVHSNNDITNVQKLYYLKQAFVGDAADLIRDFELTDSSYGQAWSLVLNRYDNKRLLIETLFRKLIDLESIKHESKIRTLLDQTDIIVRGLQAAGETVDCTFSKFLNFLLVTKLDYRTAKDFKNSLQTCDRYPTYDEIKKFLQIRSFAVEENSVSAKASKPEKNSSSKSSTPKSSFVATKAKNSCPCCSKEHSLKNCREFSCLTQQQRFDLVKTNRLCIKCLNTGHTVSQCKGAIDCTSCSGRHHTLLHRENTSTQGGTIQPSVNTAIANQPIAPVSPSSVNTTNTSNAVQSFCAKSQRSNKTVVLPTAVVKAKTDFKNNIRVVLARVLLDHCSQPTLVSESFVRKHRIRQFKNTPYNIGGITGDNCISQSHIKLRLGSRFKQFEVDIEADVVRKVPFSILSEPIRDVIRRNPSLNFAETNLAYDEVDILLGAEYYELLILSEKLSSDGIFLRDSHFGWIISGPYIARSPSVKQFCNLTTIDIQSQLQKFWEVEEVSVQELKSTEHEMCEAHFMRTFQRHEQGRFVVRLPFKLDRNTIGESRSRAVSCLKRVESKYDDNTFDQYIAFMREYEQLEHMSRVDSPSSIKTTSTTMLKTDLDSSSELTDKTFNSNSTNLMSNYYIPHRAVLKPDSTTTKLRVVFNASAKSRSNISLNDALMTGPTIQPQLYDILIRFRSHSIAFSADISKMYRQILVHESDRDMQRIVWRESSKTDVLDFRLNTITYGTAPASYIATKCLQILGNEISNSKPQAARAIKNDFCMDDLLTGAASVEEAATLRSDIDLQLRSAGFELRKYMSSSEEFLSKIEPSLVEKARTIEFSDLQTVSLLGLEWHPIDDSFSIKLSLRNLENCSSITRRIILSEIARIFDPFGFLSPVVVKAKIILQDVWKANIGWDDPVPPDLESAFRDYYADLVNLKSFVIRRRYSRFDSTECQLIGFCDASDKAYCAVIYFRSVDSFGNVDCYLVTAKTRIAPKNEFKLTIPKLELQAALLLAELLSRVARELSIDEDRLYAFSDSTVVLHWLNGAIERWSIFVQNRVRKIDKFIPKTQWYYVNTKTNPADLATRGLSASNFLKLTTFWTSGPSFLLESINSNSTSPILDKANIPETRPQFTLMSTKTDSDVIETVPRLDLSFIIEKYSSFNKLVNIVSYVLRFVNNCKRGKLCTVSNDKTVPIANTRKLTLDVNDRNNALNLLIRSEQLNRYSKEISRIENFKPLSKTSSLCKFTPFLDENCILRASSRLNNTQLSYENRNPIILFAKRKFVELLVSYVHVNFYHANRNFICNYLSTKYVIIGGLVNVVKKVIRKCTVCIRYKGVTVNQLMGQLPSSRVTVSRPFSNVGVDFAGPFSCKCVAHRCVKFYKIYTAIFVCFVTRAVHIEIVVSLSTEAFINCFQRFIARRGIPTNVHSDNATNFVGASNILDLTPDSIQNFTLEKGIKWHFIPPRAPHHGGIWESAVKAAKYHLVRVTNGQTLDFEEYHTVFTNIEGILNSRPLCYRRNAQSAVEILTPGHFLIGSPIHTLSVTDEDSSKKLRLSKRYDLLQAQIRSFWNLWSKDYLNQLKYRSKWNKQSTNLKIGDVVIVKEDNLRPSDWNFGVIEETYPDSSNTVRIVLVRYNKTTKKRAVTSLIPLLSDETQDVSSPGSMLV